ncbi:unnamed protein product [Camellia sinensis]
MEGSRIKRLGKVADYQWNVQHSLWEPHQSSATHICEEIDRDLTTMVSWGRSLGPGGEVHKTSMSPPQSKFAVIILVCHLMRIIARLIPKGAQTLNKKFLTSALRLIQGVLPQSDGPKELLVLKRFRSLNIGGKI